MIHYRAVKIAGEDVVEEPVQEPALDQIPGYDEETRLQYAGGLRKTPPRSKTSRPSKPSSNSNRRPAHASSPAVLFLESIGVPALNSRGLTSWARTSFRSLTDCWAIRLESYVDFPVRRLQASANRSDSGNSNTSTLNPRATHSNVESLKGRM